MDNYINVSYEPVEEQKKEPVLLYAIGEVACTSLHGANRLASNSLLECLVTGYELVNTLSFCNLQNSEIIDDAVMTTIKKYTANEEDTRLEADMDDYITKIKDTMWQNVGIVRDETSLLTALSDINKIAAAFDLEKICSSAKEYEVRNLIYVAKCIINSALKRKTSIGAHYRSDSVEPQVDDTKNSENVKEQPNEAKVTA